MEYRCVILGERVLMERVFNVFKFGRFWNAEDQGAGKGIVRGPDKERILEKANERAMREKCSKVIVYKEDGSKEKELQVGKDCNEL